MLPINMRVRGPRGGPAGWAVSTPEYRFQWGDEKYQALCSRSQETAQPRLRATGGGGSAPALASGGRIYHPVSSTVNCRPTVVPNPGFTKEPCRLQAP